MVGVQVGQALEIRNSDDTLHNVHPTPKKNKETNIAMPFKGKSIDQTFRRKELMFPVKCNVHPWMVAYVNVMKHPAFVVTPKGDGMATIPVKLPRASTRSRHTTRNWVR